MTTTTADSAPPAAPRDPLRHLGKAIWAAVALAILIFILLFQWNWLRGPLARVISGQLNRPVSITGDLEVHPWSWSPRATVHGLVIGNAPWAGRAPLASLPRLTVQVKLLPLLRGKVSLPLVEADAPVIGLLRDAKGRANWIFHPELKPQPLRLPPINHLIISGGLLTFEDVQHKLKFSGTVSSNEQVSGYGQGTFVLDGKGTLNTSRFVAHVTGGPLVNVDPSRAYPFDATAEAGPTRLRLVGHIAHPFNFGQMSGLLSVSGPDLADLYYVSGLTFPNSPPYSLTAGFGRNENVYALRGLRGRLGDSDLEGALMIDNDTGRPLLKGDLASRRVRLADLTAVVGGAPKRGVRATLSPQQKIVAAKLSAEHRIFPDTHLDVTRVRAMDAEVAYRAASIEAGKSSLLRALSLHVSLKKGVLDINPLNVTLPQGRLAGTIHLDARTQVPSEAVDLHLTDARLETLMAPKRGGPPPLEGGLYARAKLSSRGDSIRAAAGGADGAVTLVVSHGEMRQALAELLGINATKGLFLLLSKNQGETPIRCGIVNFRARNGVLTADRLVLDTGVVLVTGTGDVDLRNETLNFVLNGKNKKFRLIHLNAPITVKGGLLSPKFGVDIVKAAPQALISAAIGIFAAPVAAILPFIGPGLAKDADCSGLLAQAQAGPAPVKAH